MRHCCALLAGLVLAVTPLAQAEILPIRDMELAGQATVTASAWDIGHKNNLFDQNWANIYRSAAVNPVIVTVEFTQPQTVAAARGMFSHTTTHDWTLEAADTVADLDSGTGTYTLIFGPTQVTGDGIQWTEWNQSPVTRRVFRFTVYRVYGDNYVHIHELELQTYEPEELVQIGAEQVRLNTITLTPPDSEVPQGQTLQFAAEGSLCYGPDRYDLTDMVTWSSDDPGIATVDAAGVATGVSPGVTTINADLGVIHAETSLETRLVRPIDLNVGFIHRTPEYNRFKVSFDGDQHVHPSYVGEQKWPAPGEQVTYTAHIFNKGDTDAADVLYRWYFDDQLVDEGTIASLPARSQTTVAYSAPWPADTVQTVSIPAGAMDLHPQQLERAIGDHTIRIELDPLDTISEGCEINNVVEDHINALTFWLFMDETTYAYFESHPNFFESYSAEDWGRGQLIGFERRLRVGGTPQRVRLDMVAVYPDGELNGGGTHEPIGSETRQADGRWGFQIGEWPESKVMRFAKMVENPLCHEWGHQIGLIDVYQYDIATGNCLIRHDGSLVAGTSLMPTVSPWNIFYGNIVVQHAFGDSNVDATGRALMADVGRRYIAAGSAAGMNRNLGLRRGFFGDYLGAIQQGDIKLEVIHHGGTPVAGAGIRVFQREASTAQVPNNPKFIGTTDAQGMWTFPGVTEPGWEGGIPVNNPWSWVSGVTEYDAPNAGGGNAPLIVELTFGNEVEYHFIEVDECNVAMQQGQVDDYTFTLTTYASREGNNLPDITIGAGSNLQIDEGEYVEFYVSANDVDGDPVTLSATPLYNSTFDPDTGRFTFRPDSLQVSRYGTYFEAMYVDFRADDGKFVAIERVYFNVWDQPSVAYLDEVDSDGDGAGDIADPDDDNDGVDDVDDLCPGTPAGTPVGADGCPVNATGDMNCDGVVDVFDINPFVQALLDPAAYAAEHPACDIQLGDINGDASVDVFDINPFVDLLLNP